MLKRPRCARTPRAPTFRQRPRIRCWSTTFTIRFRRRDDALQDHALPGPRSLRPPREADHGMQPEEHPARGRPAKVRAARIAHAHVHPLARLQVGRERAVRSRRDPPRGAPAVLAVHLQLHGLAGERPAVGATEVPRDRHDCAVVDAEVAEPRADAGGERRDERGAGLDQRADLVELGVERVARAGRPADVAVAVHAVEPHVRAGRVAARRAAGAPDRHRPGQRLAVHAELPADVVGGGRERLVARGDARVVADVRDARRLELKPCAWAPTTAWSRPPARPS